ncbi:hypothetical protein DYH09_15845 [bacterium CPR1]|nr:hypothetical protein [bacterium CPR1]
MTRRGATLFEVIITTGVYSLMVIAVFLILRGGLRAWHNVESRQKAQRDLRRVHLQVLEDLKAASSSGLDFKPWGQGKFGAANGDALWFLSSKVPETYPAPYARAFARNPSNGEPLWQVNVLYYAVVPDNHTTCAGFRGSDGYDTACPHKYLIKKVIDLNDQSSDPNNPDQVEPLLTKAEVDTYLTVPPTPYALSGMVTGAVVPGSVQVIADALLSFRIQRPAGRPLVGLTTRAVRLVEASHARSGPIKLGQADMAGDPFTLEYKTWVVPGNR